MVLADGFAELLLLVAAVLLRLEFHRRCSLASNSAAAAQRARQPPPLSPSTKKAPPASGQLFWYGLRSSIPAFTDRGPGLARRLLPPDGELGKRLSVKGGMRGEPRAPLQHRG